MTPTTSRASSLPALSDTSSKQEEIAFLRAVAQRVPQGTYLAPLFRPEMLASVEADILNDVCADPYATIANLRRELHEERQGRERAIMAVDRAVERERVRGAELLAAADEARVSAQQRADACQRGMLETSEELSRVASELEQARALVSRLQRHIFSMEHPELAG